MVETLSHLYSSAPQSAYAALQNFKLHNKVFGDHLEFAFGKEIERGRGASSEFLLKSFWFLEQNDFMLQNLFTVDAFLGQDNFPHETSVKFSNLSISKSFNIHVTLFNVNITKILLQKFCSKIVIFKFQNILHSIPGLVI